MKRITTAFIICAAFLSSCKKDACEDVNCNDGVCESGDCICDAGYEGFNCETEERQKFISDYSAEETCNAGTFNYAISVTTDPSEVTQVIISNLGDFNFDIAAVVDGASISIDAESNGYTVVGSGTLIDGVLTLDYTLTTSAQQTLTCTVVCIAN